ncbi:hypothetical protein PFCIP103579_2157 [Prolinoborus fasciculus]|nr:hypothetical protein PFCIP103579_2157 [Prolinoborus fasciculus]
MYVLNKYSHNSYGLGLDIRKLDAGYKYVF